MTEPEDPPADGGTDVPPENAFGRGGPVPGERRGPFSRPPVLAALIAAFVLFTAGVAVGGYLTVDRAFGNDGQDDAASRERDVSVFLCIHGATEGNCRNGEATEAQKQTIKERLERMPRVRSVVYESQEQAYARFKKRFADDKDLLESVRPDALPDSFHVRVADEEAAKAVKTQMGGAPGVEAVVIGPRPPRA